MIQTSSHSRVYIVPYYGTYGAPRFRYLGLASEGTNTPLDYGGFPTHVHSIPIRVYTPSPIDVVDGDER